MNCTYPKETIDNVIAFHGHSCPGLAIGIRAAEYVAHEMVETPPHSLVCVTETDMCGVDAIQYLTGCTFGKGNLIHMDYGKTAFSFYNRKDGTGFRLVLRERNHEELTRLMAKKLEGSINEGEQKRLAELRSSATQHLMEETLEGLFTKITLDGTPPRPARILESLTCDACAEKTMESRTRRFAGQTLCIPCFRDVEQKI
jgi:formylmethanofuran dehydrogenase subunit E